MSPARSSKLRSERTWIAAYAFVMVLPVLVLVPAPSFGDGWSTFAVALGFMAYTAMAVQCVLASRNRKVSAPFGSDTLIALHRVAGVAVLVTLVAHVAVLLVTQPWARGWIYPIHGPFEAQLGLLALVCVAVLAATSIRRPRWMSYEAWRRIHLSATIVAVFAAYGHALQSSNYSSNTPVRIMVVAIFLVAILAVAYLRLARTYGALERPYVVESITDNGSDVHSLHLRAVDHDGVPFAPGQFAWLKVGGSALSLHEHPFSFASSALAPQTPTFSIKRLGDGTADIARVPPGTVVLVDGPHGDPRWALPAGGFIFIAGGIGITPALSVISTAADSGDTRSMVLVYAVTDATDIPFLDQLHDLQLRCNLTIEIVAERTPEQWTGHTGRVTTDLLRSLLPNDMGQRNVLVCGPPGMMTSVRSSMQELTISHAHVRYEAFSLA